MHKIISDTGIQTESFILAVPTFKRFEEEHAIFFFVFLLFFLKCLNKVSKKEKLNYAKYIFFMLFFQKNCSGLMQLKKKYLIFFILFFNYFVKNIL